MHPQELKFVGILFGSHETKLPLFTSFFLPNPQEPMFQMEICEQTTKAVHPTLDSKLKSPLSKAVSP